MNCENAGGYIGYKYDNNSVSMLRSVDPTDSYRVLSLNVAGNPANLGLSANAPAPVNPCFCF